MWSNGQEHSKIQIISVDIAPIYLLFLLEYQALDLDIQIRLQGKIP